MHRALLAWVIIGLGGCTASGGGGGSSAPDCTAVGGFSEHFEMRDDGPWPVCEQGEAQELETPGGGGGLTRGCSEGQHFVAIDGAGAITNWRWDGAESTVRAGCDVESGAAENLMTFDLSDVSTTCRVECWGDGCEGYPACP